MVSKAERDVMKGGKERHLKGYNFCGPNTKLAARLNGQYQSLMKKHNKPLAGKAPYGKPANVLDAACKRHDKAFSKVGLSAKQVRIADEDLIKSAKAIQNNTRLDNQLRRDARKVRYGIRGKVIAEEAGILRKGAFSSGGETKKEQAKRVAKKVAKAAGRAVVAKATSRLTKLLKGGK